MLHLNFFQFNESMTNTDLIRYSKAYIIKFQSDFSRLSVLVPFLSKLLKFHLLILKPFSPAINGRYFKRSKIFSNCLKS